jgi:CTP:molybdopterin cytidylyltransferase MocA
MAEPTSASVLVAVLAGGVGSRWDGPGHKLDAHLGGQFGGRSVATAAVGAALEAAIGPVVVITGAVEPALPPDFEVERIHNPDWADGQSTSLRSAVAEAERHGVDALVVGLADQPFVEPEAWRRVAGSSSPIAVATYGGKRRNPVRLHRSTWALLPSGGDVGARDLIRMRPDLVDEVPCPGSPADIDTLEDLRRWQSKSSTSSP